MKRMILLLAFVLASPVLAQSPAARVGGLTNHGGSITGPGVPTVLIGGLPAAVLGDQTTCPLFNDVPPDPIPHVGGPIVTASGTVFIGGKRAARVGDVNAENGSSATIVSGAATVVIGP
jgi:uncharacterized Zn-binding protein involved in type VI secretion